MAGRPTSTKTGQFPNRVRELRLLVPGLTQEILADRLNTTHSAIGKIERGEVRLTGDKIGPLVAALGCHPLELFTPLSLEEREALNILRAASPQVRAKLLQVMRAVVDIPEVSDATPRGRKTASAA